MIVVWVDASFHPGYVAVDNSDTKCMDVYTCGWLLRMDETEVLVAQSLDGQQGIQPRDVIAIPAGMVRRVLPLGAPQGAYAFHAGEIRIEEVEL